MFFRRHTITTAQQLGLRGWVRNDPDGAVVGEAAGDQALLDSFTAFLHQGPPAAKVELVSITPVESPSPGLDELPLPFALRKHAA